MKGRRVVFPTPNWVVVEFRQEDRPGVAMVDHALAGFDAKEMFPWHLSMMVQLQDVVENDMPSIEERGVLETVESTLSARLAVSGSSKPNGLLLARITWNGTRELIYRMHDAEAADAALKDIIRTKAHKRPFDYRMEHDPNWSKAAWSLEAASGRLNRRRGGN